jgi:hypothetical protein
LKNRKPEKGSKKRSTKSSRVSEKTSVKNRDLRNRSIRSMVEDKVSNQEKEEE